MAVAFDAVGPSAAGQSASGNTGAGGLIFTWNHTCAGANRALFVSVSVGVGDAAGVEADITVTVTYNGVSMTSIGKVINTGATTGGFVQAFSLVAPATGLNVVSVTLVSVVGHTVAVEAGSVSDTGVDQSTPTRNVTTATGNSANPTVAVSSAVGNMVIDGLACGDAVSTSTQTNRWKDNQNSVSTGGNGAQSSAAGAASATMAYTIAADHWSLIGYDVVAAVAAGGDVITQGAQWQVAIG